jgi:hypothetical protein
MLYFYAKNLMSDSEVRSNDQTTGSAYCGCPLLAAGALVHVVAAKFGWVEAATCDLISFRRLPNRPKQFNLEDAILRARSRGTPTLIVRRSASPSNLSYRHFARLIHSPCSMAPQLRPARAGLALRAALARGLSDRYRAR